MEYDAVSKRLLRLGAKPILSRLLGLPISESEEVRESPTETVSVRHSDSAHIVTLRDGSRRLVLVEFQTHWDPRVPLRLLEYEVRHRLRQDFPVVARGSIVGILTHRELLLAFRWMRCFFCTERTRERLTPSTKST